MTYAITICEKRKYIMKNTLHMKKIIKCGRALLLSFVFGLSACTSPLWWQDTQREFTYKGYKVKIVSQDKVFESCSQWDDITGSSTSPMILGCVSPATAEAWSVNNPYVLSHECSHMDAFTDESFVSKETAEETVRQQAINDALLSITGISELMTMLTLFSPAGDGC